METLNDLLDLDTFVEVRKAAPEVTFVSFDIARQMLEGIGKMSAETHPFTDHNDRKYWQASIKDLHRIGGFPETLSLRKTGSICKSLGLISWRKNDGYHIAWSEQQLSILKGYFYK